MSQFDSRQAVVDWLNAHAKQGPIRLTGTGTTLRLIGRTDGIQELDACSADIPYGELQTDIPGVHVGVTLHDETLSLHVLMGDPDGGRAPVSLPLSLPYVRLRLATADAPEEGEFGAMPEEPDFSPYELLHFPRPD